MSDLVPVTDGQVLDTLAVQIREAHEACEAAITATVQHAIRAGELLNEAKAQVRHGEWLPWLAENFDGTRRLASSYMRVAANGKRVSHLDSIREAITELANPREASDAHDDPITAYIFGCANPVPPRYERAHELLAAWMAKRSWIDRHEYLRPPGDDQSIEGQLRWLAGSHAIEAGAKVVAEIALLYAEIAGPLPEITGPERGAIERRAAEIVALSEARIAELGGHEAR